MTHKYTKKQKFGEGTYCNCFLVVDTDTQEEFVMKKVQIDQEEDGITTSIIREISSLKRLKHPCIVCLKDVSIEGNSLEYVFERMWMDLSTYNNKNKKPLKIDLVRSYAYQLILGIDYMHSKGIIHRDLKPSNILIDKKGFLKIADFGKSREISIPITPMTPNDIEFNYMSPEVLLGADNYGLPIDIWSAACIIAELCTPKKRKLFSGDSPIDQIAHIFKILGTPDNNIWDGCTILPNFPINMQTFEKVNLGDLLEVKDDNLIDLLEKMLEYDQKKRISAHDALNHPFFDNLDYIKKILETKE